MVHYLYTIPSANLNKCQTQCPSPIFPSPLAPPSPQINPQILLCIYKSLMFCFCLKLCFHYISWLHSFGKWGYWTYSWNDTSYCFSCCSSGGVGARPKGSCIGEGLCAENPLIAAMGISPQKETDSHWFPGPNEKHLVFILLSNVKRYECFMV